MSNFLKSIVDIMDDATIASDGKGAAEYDGFIDTGCYLFNAVLSGSIYGGLPNNKITALAGEPATGKTFFALGIIKHFLDANKKATVVYFDTEAAVTRRMLDERDIDTKRVLLVEPDTIQNFRTKALKIIDAYEKDGKSNPCMFVLDSLGMLSTTKEMEDSAEGKETRDMTKAATIKAVFRVLTLRLAKAKIPMIVTNHVYDAVGAYVPTKVMGGGSGLQYAASSIVFLSKSKDKDGKDVVGNFIRVRMQKSRMSKENAVVQLKLSYQTGLDKYHGLLDLAEKYNVIKKVTAQSYELADGTRIKGTEIRAIPESVFTPDVLQQLELAAQKEFRYGGNEESSDDGADYGGEDLVVEAEGKSSKGTKGTDRKSRKKLR